MNPTTLSGEAGRLLPAAPLLAASSFRSLGVWLLWATWLTWKTTRSYRLAKEWYGGINTILLLMKCNPHRYRARICCIGVNRPSVATTSPEGTRSRTACNPTPAPEWRAQSPTPSRLLLMPIAVLLDLWMLAASLWLCESLRGLYPRRLAMWLDLRCSYVTANYICNRKDFLAIGYWIGEQGMRFP